MSRTKIQPDDQFRERVERWEAEFLSDRATRSYPAVRRVPEPDSPVRTPFQRDRDRIAHSKAFRRLKHKTQVFIAPEGDHYRTRLTHTLETCFIARTVARALGLNEDLTEAIGLGHDLGHPPFGHIGEEALDQALRERGAEGFRHNLHSLRMVDELEREGEGLNLTEPVRDGILNHTGPTRPATLEGQVVRLVDRVAYINHDIDDAVRAGILAESDLPAKQIALLGPTGSARIDTLVRDIVASSRDGDEITQSKEIGGAMLRLRKFMFDAGLPRPGGAQRARPRAPDGGGAVRLLPRGGPRRAGGGRLHRRDDRPVRDRHLQARRGARGIAAVSFTRESVERVKEASDVVEVVSAYTELRRSGVRFTGLCPFHDERTPSFSVNPQDKLYHCFGCGVGGDVIKFVEEKEGLAFPDAVEALADRYGVELEREAEDPRAEELRRKRARLSELLERTASFYASFLRDAPQARRARDYLAGRGLGAEVLEAFGVGCAPGTWDTILIRGQKAGYSVEEIEAAGLVLRSQKGRGHYDRFRSRIVFPIRDARGRVQGFGARALLPDQKPKYVNSPEGELYSKRRTLYGIERARPQIVKSGSALVVEGYTDVLACEQAQIGGAVAIMGTAITPEQVKLLSAYAEEAVLALDADRAGREAMLRAQGVGGRRLRLRVARMPEGKDPADLLAGGDAASKNAFRAAIEAAEELPVFHVHTLLDDADLSSPSGRDRALDEVVGVVAAMPDSISREELMREIGGRLEADPGLVARRVSGAGRSGRAAPAYEQDPGPQPERRSRHPPRGR